MGKSLNLGLEALSFNTTANGSGEISIDLVDSVIRVNTASEALQMDIFEGDKLMQAFENLCSIQDAIKKEGGVSAALEALVGDNFGGRVSMEGVTDTLKKWWDAIIRWFTNMWDKIKTFFKELFDRNAHWSRVLPQALKEFKEKNVDEAKLKENSHWVIINDQVILPTENSTVEEMNAYCENALKKVDASMGSKAMIEKAAEKCIGYLAQAKKLSDGADKLFSDSIKTAKEAVATLQKVSADSKAIEEKRAAVKELQAKASAYSKVCTAYSKAVNAMASSLVSAMKSAPKKAEEKKA